MIHDERRRYVLYYLDMQDTPVHIDELAEEVAKMESNSSDDKPSEKEIEQFEVQLHHKDIPKATEAEFVDYDSADGAIQLTDEPPTFEALLTVAKAIEEPM